MYNLILVDTFTYNLKIMGENNNILYKTIKHIIKSTHIDEKSDSIFFNAENVMPLKNYKMMTYYNCIQMIDELTKQINYLNDNGYSFYGFDVDMIMKIDDHFIFCSSKYLEELDKNKNIKLYFIDNKPYFSNPEILQLTTLPSLLNYKCCYYSLGLLIIFYLFGEYLLVANDIPSENKILDMLMPFKNTKIYWFLIRCLKSDINKRELLLV